jgi:hypothetical protein
VLPAADDTYWLGSDTLGWKGLKMPDLKAYQLNANTMAIDSIGGVRKNLDLATLYAQTAIGVGLGYTTAVPNDPTTALEVSTTLATSPRGIMSSQFSTDTNGARFHMRKGRGTRGTPTVIVSGDMLGRLVASGYDGANYLEMGAVEIVSTGTIAATRVPTQLKFYTATNVAPSFLTLALTITETQDLMLTNGKAIQAANTDDNTMLFKARDNGVGLVQIGALIGGADPYPLFGRDDTGMATNAVSTVLSIQGGAGTNNEAANFGTRISLLLGNAASEVEERASIDAILVTATNGTESSKIRFRIQSGGSIYNALDFSASSIAFAAGSSASILGSSGGNLSIYGNNALSDGTARDIILAVLDTTGDAWRTVIQVQGGAGVTSATAKIGLWGAAPVVQAAHIDNAAGGTEIATINAILVVLENFGAIATS